jgi:DNA invertase Pin-like site-specific DNA recombinase
MLGVKYGYARVSTDDQTPALQLAALKKAGCKTTFKDDGLSGATTKRPALLRCLKKLESGDTLIVWKLDRLGRSLRDLIAMLDDLKRRGVKFRSLTEAIETETPTGRAMWQMIGVLAENEIPSARDVIRAINLFAIAEIGQNHEVGCAWRRADLHVFGFTNESSIAGK